VGPVGPRCRPRFNPACILPGRRARARCAGGLGGSASRGKAGINGTAGTADGGGLYVVASGATVTLDTFTYRNALGNSPDDIVGPYTVG
jgi:hypothetical protein